MYRTGYLSLLYFSTNVQNGLPLTSTVYYKCTERVISHYYSTVQVYRTGYLSPGLTAHKEHDPSLVGDMGGEVEGLPEQHRGLVQINDAHVHPGPVHEGGHLWSQGSNRVS